MLNPHSCHRTCQHTTHSIICSNTHAIVNIFGMLPIQWLGRLAVAKGENKHRQADVAQADEEEGKEKSTDKEKGNTPQKAVVKGGRHAKQKPQDRRNDILVNP